ncbi:MAG TPA: 2-oxoacid:acceptor oxidoreductase family protein [Longimicrobiales bacterium]
MFMNRTQPKPKVAAPKYPGVPDAADGSTAVVIVETAASDAAGAYPITPSTQMGEGWALAVAAGEPNVFGRRLLFFEPEGEHAAAAVTAGMSMTGLRATNFSSGQGVVYMHESLYPAVGKRLTYVLNVAARALTKHSLNVHAGHDDYHAVDDTGFFQLFAKDVQEAADLTLIAHRIAELSLNPGICAQDGFLTSHVIETLLVPERDLIREYLGDPADLIDSPTPAQRMVFGEKRRRIPEMFDYDYPAMLGVVQNQESYAQGVAAQRPFYFDHIPALTDRAMAEYATLTGREYARASGYLMEDAEYVLAGQGSVVANMEAVADHLRATRGLRVGVLNLTMFRPFPADIVSRLLSGRRAVTVLERTDQPLAADAPLLREIRAAMGRAVENGRAAWRTLPHQGLGRVRADDVPDFYSGGFGFGSRDLQPADIIAAVENMLPSGRNQRQFYLGIDFIRRGTRLPKLQIWQEQLIEAYPHVAELALEPAQGTDLLPDGAIALRIHSVGGWGAITTGKNVALTAFELAGLHVKANPKYGSEKKGQPTTFYATLSRERNRLNGELRHVNVVLSPDGNVFRHSNPLSGLAEGGVFVMQSDQSAADTWADLPAWARRQIRHNGIRMYVLDGFRIAAEEASDPELRYRMQGAAFMGAFFRASPLAVQESLSEEQIFEGIRAQMQRKFGKLGERVVDDNVRVIRRGWEELVEIDTGIEVTEDDQSDSHLPHLPRLMDVQQDEHGVGSGGRFFEQVCALNAVGQDPIADPFAAISAMPAVSSTVRDMTGIRFEVPDFIAEKCTGCAQCWTQCPDSAIPGLVTSVEDLLDGAVKSAAARGHTVERIRSIARPLAKETRKVIDAVDFRDFGEAVSTAYANVAAKLGWEPDRRAELDTQFAAVHPILAQFPVAKTAPFYDMPESKQKGTGGLLSVTINPEACKGCNICVDVCPENALVTIRQDEPVVEKLRENWAFWQQLPDTDDRYINIRNLDEGIGALPSLLLKKKNYLSMVGGDGACMGCGEKTAVHLVVSTIEALMQPRVRKLVERIDALLEKLEQRAEGMLTAKLDIEQAALASADVTLPVAAEQRPELVRIARAMQALKDLRWRYTEGPGGRGRAALGIANSTGCSSVWASTYPYNPYPFPWVNHLFQDAPSVAIGIFEGHMRKMADNFAAVRRAELIADGAYDEARDEAFLRTFDWKQFSDEEFALAPPVMAIGGDGAMLDIGFQNLSRLMASGKPIRVLVLDTQVYSNTGGQACTSGFTGQIADMSAYGKAQHGKSEVRKELALIAMAHRGTFVHQTSQASATHLIGGVIRGLNSRRPAIFSIYTPCPVEHGLPDEWAPHGARLALESRAFPFLTYDPDAGSSLAECLSLEGNPAVDEVWPTYRLSYVEDGETRELELPLTIADWAATESRFRKHFRDVPADRWNDDMVVFHEYVRLDAAEREGRTAFVHAVDREGRLRRLSVAQEIVDLAHDRLRFWDQLREMAGIRVADSVKDSITASLEAEYDARVALLTAEYERRIADLKATYPRVVARRMAESLIQGNEGRTIREIVAEAARMRVEPIGPDVLGTSGNGSAVAAAAGMSVQQTGTASGSVVAAATAPTESSAPAAEVAPAQMGGPVEEDDGLALEPYIDTDRCTTCNECTNLNGKMFAYDDNKQAYIKDARAGTFAQLVQAAERCPAGLIHPGTPLNPNEKDLAKWVARAEPFN